MNDSKEERFRRLLGVVINDTTELKGIRLIRERDSRVTHAVTVIALSVAPLENYSVYEFGMVPKDAPIGPETLMACFEEQVRPALEALGCTVLKGPPHFAPYDLIDYPVIING